ncbi:hypothetical protein [Mycobacterium marinum]|uniref:hypothetical protein n=1 Tax=Mycobacterium marinum TaxID=1781 RepID=UPI0003588979|nr:hypothetical protein [Mycobacterium marinum]EPQ70989.1 putative secreted protein [Mycobacterium marinum MB2]MDC8971645.1 hypothetical protein [Mycobacterium marinum]MDC8984930.1 hypothetical protein [Mycobacterium marinum]MDC9002126.1 hypothetical protein [Mycobacterium marinum]MDC9012902.1 hypothetical protein [Mycobacterium marinum]
MAFRIGMNIAAWVLCAGAVVGAPPVQAAPGAVLPPIPSTGGGPIIGGGDEAAQSRIARQLMSVGNADVQEGDGADAASFIMDSAQVADSRLASAFAPLQRALGCQKVNTSFGARAYRRSDGGWGGAMLVIAESATSDMQALTGCIRSVWPAATAGGSNAMCAHGWTYPTSGQDHRPETYHILLAGTAADFCAKLDEDYANFATNWP